MKKRNTDYAVYDQFRIIYENISDAILLTKPDGTVLSANPAATKMFRMTENEIKKAGRNGLVIADNRLNFALIKREKTGNTRVELTLKRKDGSTFEAEVTSNLFKDSDGIIKTAMVIHDITECKKANQRIISTNEKMRVVGSLTRHDVRNKLSIIKSNAYLIKKKLGDNPEIASYLENIENAVEASNKLFEFSSNYEKIGSEERSEVDVEECFKQAVILLPENKIIFNTECAGLKILADSLFRQLFYNLLENSVKHGKKVTEIRLSTKETDDEKFLVYEDNGVGIPEANKVKIFTEGFTTSNGSGLGLMLVKKIAEAYGWNITEEGQSGKGARFIISLRK